MNMSWKSSAAVLACASTLIAASAARADWPAPRVNVERVNVEIFDRSEGRTLPIYHHDGRRYVVGRPGNEYAIRVRNTGSERVLAVMSVDGARMAALAQEIAIHAAFVPRIQRIERRCISGGVGEHKVFVAGRGGGGHGTPSMPAKHRANNRRAVRAHTAQYDMRGSDEYDSSA